VTHHSGCLICGAPLAYQASEEVRSCAVCGKSAATNAWCVGGHFVCDACHGVSAVELIYETCRRATTTDPLRLAVELMRSPLLHLHGPEHHFLVPAVLLAAWATARGLSGPARDERLAEARRRAAAVKGGLCGLWGACGAGVGTGIFVSVALGATPLARREWRLANQMTAAALMRIAAHGGPRCCKRCTYLAIGEAVAFVAAHLETRLAPAAELRCEHHEANQECLKDECPYYSAK
jgi:hypothetical protein